MILIMKVYDKNYYFIFVKWNIKIWISFFFNQYLKVFKLFLDKVIVCFGVF